MLAAQVRGYQDKETAIVETLDLAKEQISKYPKILVFCEKCVTVDQLCDTLRDNKYNVGAMHGDKTQEERDKAVDGFKKGRIHVLVATDVMSRGLDIPHVNVVINYDMPKLIDDYVSDVMCVKRLFAQCCCV